MNINALVDHLRVFQTFVDKWREQADRIIKDGAPTGRVGITCDDDVALTGLQTTELLERGMWRIKNGDVVVEVVYHDPVNNLVHLNTGSGMEEIPKIETIGGELFLRLFDYVDVFSRQHR